MDILPTHNTDRGRRTGVAPALMLLSLLAASHSSAIEVVIPLPGMTNSYAECVIEQVDTDIGAVAIQAITSSCRSRFPGPSKRDLLDARTVQACYNKYEHLVSHREAAKAIYGACQDYFRGGSAANTTALRGSRLNAR